MVMMIIIMSAPFLPASLTLQVSNTSMFSIIVPRRDCSVASRTRLHVVLVKTSENEPVGVQVLELYSAIGTVTSPATGRPSKVSLPAMVRQPATVRGAESDDGRRSDDPGLRTRLPAIDTWELSSRLEFVSTTSDPDVRKR